MTKWKKEIELIDNLGLLYPEIECWENYDEDWSNCEKAYWIRELCIYHLDQSIPQLEKFIKKYCSKIWWEDYKNYFCLNE